MDQPVLPSTRLLLPRNGVLEPATPSPAPTHPACAGFTREVQRIFTQKNYPCVAALRSFFRDDYAVGVYRGFGDGRDWQSLRQDLCWFLEEQQRSASPYLTMWAVFPQAPVLDEDAFEHAMWNELSFLTSVEDKALDWAGADAAASDPSAREFSFRLFGQPLFVVGLHPHSSRKGRTFPFTAMVFNAFAQFERLEQAGLYDPMVEKNRHRDEAFQGAPNPMTLTYGDDWEAIQFSGKENPPDWKCPFRFLTAAEKGAR